jgi:hypothetical protein
LFENGLSIKLGEYPYPCISGDYAHRPLLANGFPALGANETDVYAQLSLEDAVFFHPFICFPPLSKS